MALFGLRSTVLLHGDVVEQSVSWRPRWLFVDRWQTVGEGLPNPGGGRIGRYRWIGPSTIEVDSASTNLVQAGAQAWQWTNHNGVELRLDRIKMCRAKRGSNDPGGDMALLVVMLSLFVGLAQANTLLVAIIGPSVAETTTFEPSPELIARLLKRKLSGAKSGAVARVERPQFKLKSPSIYLPAGSKGPMARAGGGAQASEQPKKMPPTAVTGEVPKVDLSETITDGVAERLILDLASKGHTLPDPTVAPPAHPEVGLPASIERFIGWGFHDWMEVSEAASPDANNQLELARRLMALDPDEPYAILTVAYYAYLSEEFGLCKDLYSRYVHLFPDDAAGWNNLALTYKRAGEYGEEERLYRRALSIEPNNANTINNLALSLAHQGQYLEAEALMRRLQPKAHERPFANLHRAKIAAAQGKDRKAYRFLRRALSDVSVMDTVHHIEFRQDIRLDPSLARLRGTPKLKRLLLAVYGDDIPVGRNPPTR